MNAARRKEITAAVANLEEARAAFEAARDMVEQIKSDEEEYLANMPESLQGGEKGERAQAAIDALEEAHDKLDIDFDDIFSLLENASE